MRRLLVGGMALGTAVAIVVIGLAFATGSTFGQRCASAGHEWGSAAFDACVAKLKRS